MWKIRIGECIADKFNGKIKTPVISTISGVVVEFKEMVDRNGKVVDHCVIENDFKGSTVHLVILLLHLILLDAV